MGIYGFHLLLDKKDNGVLLEVITKLQKKYSEMPPFYPHITAYTSVKAPLSKVKKIAEKSVSETRKFDVEFEDFGYGEKWSKILYIKLKFNQNLDDIHEKIGKELDYPDKREYTPHISLMYNDDISLAERLNITNKLKLAGKFRVNAISVVSPGSPDGGWRDYLKWFTVYKKSLGN